MMSLGSDTPNSLQPSSAPRSSTFSRLAGSPRYTLVEHVQQAIALDEATINEATLSEHTIQDGKREFILERWDAGKRKRTTWIAEHGTWIIELLPGNKKAGHFGFACYMGSFSLLL